MSSVKCVGVWMHSKEVPFENFEVSLAVNFLLSITGEVSPKSIKALEHLLNFKQVASPTEVRGTTDMLKIKHRLKALIQQGN